MWRRTDSQLTALHSRHRLSAACLEPRTPVASSGFRAVTSVTSLEIATFSDRNSVTYGVLNREQESPMLRRVTSRLGVLVCALTATAAFADVAHAGLPDLGTTATVSTATQPAVEAVNSAVQTPAPAIAPAAVQAPVPVVAPAVQAPAPAVASPVVAVVQTVSGTASETTRAVTETVKPVTESVNAAVNQTNVTAPVRQVTELVQQATANTTAALPNSSATQTPDASRGPAPATGSTTESNAPPTMTPAPATPREAAVRARPSAKKIRPARAGVMHPITATPMTTTMVADSKGGRASDAPAKRTPRVPDSPQMPPSGLNFSALGDGGGSAPLLFGLLGLLFLLAIPTAVRWLRPALALGLSPAYVAPGDRPG